ncbi:hypothetical protein [uncultured Muriicola sp.]|uniref:hypothetical protein n=1 Tax=uncultured Muriicola sp. TaxID=1583102 RepID=UPI00262E673E|nr:hypothetical protein [uncultured Muriicola sp.]
MTKLLSILAALLILIQSFNISYGDIAQLDELLEHAAFHKKQYGDNLFVFISKHYGELKEDHHKKHAEEHEEHENLPFQHNSCTHHIVNALVLFPNSITREKYEVNSRQGDDFYYLQSDSSGHQSGVFQPPRHA